MRFKDENNERLTLRNKVTGNHHCAPSAPILGLAFNKADGRNGGEKQASKQTNVRCLRQNRDRLKLEVHFWPRRGKKKRSPYLKRFFFFSFLSLLPPSSDSVSRQWSCQLILFGEEATTASLSGVQWVSAASKLVKKSSAASCSLAGLRALSVCRRERAAARFIRPPAPLPGAETRLRRPRPRSTFPFCGVRAVWEVSHELKVIENCWN